MITAIEATPAQWSDGAESGLSARIGTALDDDLDVLHVAMDAALRDAVLRLPAGHAGTLHREHSRWQAVTGWRLINAADPCGT